MAAKAYGCNVKEAGLSYARHLLGIGATIILYCSRACNTEQHCLRWQSLSFLTYLGDVPRAAINHSMMIVSAPNIKSWI
jgi:hypothetical protein